MAIDRQLITYMENAPNWNAISKCSLGSTIVALKGEHSVHMKRRSEGVGGGFTADYVGDSPSNKVLSGDADKMVQPIEWRFMCISPIKSVRRLDSFPSHKHLSTDNLLDDISARSS